jgi:putative transposase
MASESSRTRSDRTKDGSIRAAFASLVERLIGTVRREYLDRTLFWTTVDLERKLIDFQHYYNRHRTHAGLEGRLPEPSMDGSASPILFDSYTWRNHCRGLYQTAIAA